VVTESGVDVVDLSFGQALHFKDGVTPGTSFTLGLVCRVVENKDNTLVLIANGGNYDP
jgi:hypothetical protein